jgi:hypothetical protein
VRRVQVLHQHEGHAIAVRQAAHEFDARIEAPGRRADAHYRQVRRLLAADLRSVETRPGGDEVSGMDVATTTCPLGERVNYHIAGPCPEPVKMTGVLDHEPGRFANEYFPML